MMSAIEVSQFEIIDEGQKNELLAMARAFLLLNGDSKIAMARAMLTLMDT